MRPQFTDAQVLLIRAEWEAGTCDTRAWAEAMDVSLETIRRIGRKDTYRGVGREADPQRTRPAPQARTAVAPSSEPSPAEVSASLDRLQRELASSPPKVADRVLAELIALGKEAEHDPPSDPTTGS